jgi:membrane-bound inhibitor of C-type lysozyme
VRAFPAVLLLSLGLASCAGGKPAPPKTVSFLCPNGTVLLATFDADGDRMRLRVNNRDYDLPRLISASGARYGDERTIFWNKGREAMLERQDGASYAGCVAD